MIQIVENWALIEGRITGVRVDGAAAGHTALDIRVAAVKPIESFPNLLVDAEGTVITVHVRDGIVEPETLKIGAVIRVRVRRHGIDRYYAHPDAIRITLPGSDT